MSSDSCDITIPSAGARASQKTHPKTTARAALHREFGAQGVRARRDGPVRTKTYLVSSTAFLTFFPNTGGSARGRRRCSPRHFERLREPRSLPLHEHTRHLQGASVR